MSFLDPTKRSDHCRICRKYSGWSGSDACIAAIPVANVELQLFFSKLIQWG